MANAKDAQVVYKNSFPTLSILTIIFVVAKLAGIVHWSWWLVFLPLYGPLALFLGVLLLCGIGVLVAVVAVSIYETLKK